MATKTEVKAEAPKSTNSATLAERCAVLHKAVLEAETRLNDALGAREAVIKEMLETRGKGPHKLSDGSIVSIMARTETAPDAEGKLIPTGKVSYFFRTLVPAGMFKD